MKWRIECQTCKYATYYGGNIFACSKTACSYSSQEVVISNAVDPKTLMLNKNTATNVVEPKITSDEETKQYIQQLQDKLNNALDSLVLIWDLGHDYDGFNTVDGLKSLIDDICTIAKDGLYGANTSKNTLGAKMDELNKSTPIDWLHHDTQTKGEPKK